MEPGSPVCDVSPENYQYPVSIFVFCLPSSVYDKETEVFIFVTSLNHAKCEILEAVFF
jgi:hypothetical protein